MKLVSGGSVINGASPSSFGRYGTHEAKFKGLKRKRVIGSAVAGFNLARTITKVSATGVDSGHNDSNKGICSPGSLVNIPVR